MASAKAHHGGPPHTEATSENPPPVPGPRRRGRQPVPLPVRLESVHAAYTAVLAGAPLSAETRRTYASKARQYLAWLDAAHVHGDPLADPTARDRAVHDWRTHLLTVAEQAPATVNNALAAVDDFYTRRGMGRAAAERSDVPATAPRALGKRAQLRWLHAVEAHPSPRDRALAGVPFYAGARIAETVRLDTADLDTADLHTADLHTADLHTADLHTAAGTGVLRIHGKGDRIREVPLHPKLRTDIQLWLEARPNWPGADTNPALFLNHRGGRLSVRGARDVIARIAETAGLDNDTTAHVLRHTFATTLIRGGTDLVTVADLLGHARLETTRAYTQPANENRAKALELLPVDR